LNETLRGGTGLSFGVTLGPPSDDFDRCDTAGPSLKTGREAIFRKPSGGGNGIH